jgi:hypothetical protein
VLVNAGAYWGYANLCFVSYLILLFDIDFLRVVMMMTVVVIVVVTMMMLYTNQPNSYPT